MPSPTSKKPKSNGPLKKIPNSAFVRSSSIAE
jgi:hypothetical protein